MKKIQGNIVDVINRSVYPGEISFSKNRIQEIKRLNEEFRGKYILPGFVDSHVHVESSMLIPSRFAESVYRHGTVATVSDPHEIANVLGTDGVDFMIKDAKKAALKIYFGAPSCVPATNFESSGAKIGPEEIDKLLQKKEVKYLSEMMNYPGVIMEDHDVGEKIRLARLYNKRIDGHAPGLRGKDLKKYVHAGIETDHECFSLEEAIEKIEAGMKIQIREGSAARNFETLYPLVDMYPEKVMFCLDDMHPDELLKGHINLIVKRSLEKGLDLFNVLRAAGYNAVKHYNLNVGMLQQGDRADFIIIDDLKKLNVLETWIEGKNVFNINDIKDKKEYTKTDLPNKFIVNDVTLEDIKIKDKGKDVKIIKAIDGELITKISIAKPKIENDLLVSDTGRDILKLVVQNRYEKEKPSVGFISNFGIKKGGMISTIAHDSHNIICLGTDDAIIVSLIKWINQNKGGIAFSDGSEIFGLTLPVAGIMSDESAERVSEKYKELDEKVKRAGSSLKSPFMTLSFMSLLVIPELKLGNKGLFDVTKFEFSSLYS